MIRLVSCLCGPLFSYFLRILAIFWNQTFEPKYDKIRPHTSGKEISQIEFPDVCFQLKYVEECLLVSRVLVMCSRLYVLNVLINAILKDYLELSLFAF